MASQLSLALRLAVEAVIIHDGKVLLAKRSPDCKVAPNVWNVPAGKVKLLETTTDAVVRETLEETGLAVRVNRLICESAFTMKSGNETVYRNMFTYYLSPVGSVKVTLNEEHTEYAWVTKEQLSQKEYASLNERLVKLIAEVL